MNRLELKVPVTEVDMTRRQWILRSGGVADLGMVGEFRKEGNGRRSCNPDYYDWKIFRNPYEQGVMSLADHSGCVIGLTTITPKTMLIKGERVLGAEIGDSFTAPEFQRQGIMSSMVKMTTENGIAKGLWFIYGTPNKNSHPGYVRNCGYVDIENAQIELLVRPLKFGRVLKNKLGLESVTLVGPLISPFFRLRYPLLPSSHKKSGFYVTKASGAFPDSAGALAGKSGTAYDWIVFRNKEYLDWRFLQNPDAYNIWFAVDGDDFLGYIVCKTGTWHGLRVGYIGDFLVDERRSGVFEELLSHAARAFLDDKLDMIATWAVKGGHYSRILRSRGFLRAWPVPLIFYNNEAGAKTVDSVAHWHFTMADSDNI